MILAGDIGGTKTLLRCVDADGRVASEQRYESAAWSTFDDLLRDFLTVPVEAACFAVAGPVWGGHAAVTNLQWEMSEEALAAAFPLGRVALINDFHAVALGVPSMHDDDLVSLQQGRRDLSQPIAILGAGTGLGEAYLVDGRVVSTEGGHCDFAPQDEEQTRLFLYLHERYGHVSWERVASGIGLIDVYAFLGGQAEDAAEIGELANSGDERARRAFAIFVDAYGAEAGNMALKALTRGGVFLAGGIAAKNLPWFTDGRFIEAFVRKGRFRELMETIPVDLIVNAEVGLIGAAEGARRLLESR